MWLSVSDFKHWPDSECAFVKKSFTEKSVSDFFFRKNEFCVKGFSIFCLYISIEELCLYLKRET